MTLKRVQNEIKAMADLDTRKGSILRLLADGKERTVTEISLYTDIPQYAVRTELRSLMDSTELCSLKRHCSGSSGRYLYRLSLMRMKHSEYLYKKRTEKHFDSYLNDDETSSDNRLIVMKLSSDDCIQRANMMIGSAYN